MCGIFGYYSFRNKNVDKDKFNESLLTIIHRGPDSQKSQFYNNDRIALGHVRLSIIDLTESANQPMNIGKYHIVYNGEIYNYIEIREELKTKGYIFSTNSDTEVIVNAFDYWGEDCVVRFNGMWAFAILDETINSLFCSRDRFGVKPFNYYVDEDRLIFSSEIKPIISYDKTLVRPNYNSIGLFCRESICNEIPETWFENVLRLMPAHNLVVKNNELRVYKYYNYPTKTVDKSFENARKEFSDLFIDSVKLRMRSDVPVGATLSGGLDSTSVVAALRTFFSGSLETFTARFSGFVNDESVVANKTNNVYKLNENQIEIDYENKYIDILSKIIYHMESGNLSPSIFPLWKIYDNASKKVTVVLEGQGADELLAGYIDTYSGAFIAEKFLKLKFKSAIKNFIQLTNNYSKKNILIQYLRMSMPSYLRTIVRRRFLKHENVLKGKLADFKYMHSPTVKSDSKLKRLLLKSHQTTLVNLLHYGDAISMAFSIESRLPFLDYRLVDFVFELPSDYLIADGKGKYIQREALKTILPDYINTDVKKLGFPSPINDFFTQNKLLIESILLDKKTLSRGLFDEKNLSRIIRSNLYSVKNSSRFIFRLLCVELWFRIFIDKD